MNLWLKGISSLGHVVCQLRNWDSKTQWYIKIMFGTAPRFTNGAVFCFDSTSSLTSGAQDVLVKCLAKPLFMVDKKGWNVLNILLFSLFFFLFFFFLCLFPVLVPSLPAHLLQPPPSSSAPRVRACPFFICSPLIDRTKKNVFRSLTLLVFFISFLVVIF